MYLIASHLDIATRVKICGDISGHGCNADRIYRAVRRNSCGFDRVVFLVACYLATVARVKIGGHVNRYSRNVAGSTG